MEYQFHPIADLFPLLEGVAFDALVEDMRANGYAKDNPIRTFEGKILDGRNRYLACKRANIEPLVKAWKGTDPYVFVAQQNLIRRHLSLPQAADIAETMATMKEGRPKTTMPVGIVSRTSIPAVAKLMGVSKQSVHRMRVIKKSGDAQVLADVKSGKISIREGVRKVSGPVATEDAADPAVIIRKRHVATGFRGPQKRAPLKSVTAAIEAIEGQVIFFRGLGSVSLGEEGAALGARLAKAIRHLYRFNKQLRRGE